MRLRTFMSDGAIENPKAALALSAAPIVISVGLMSSPTLPNTAPDGPIAIPVGEMTSPTADSTAPVADTYRMWASYPSLEERTRQGEKSNPVADVAAPIAAFLILIS